MNKCHKAERKIKDANEEKGREKEKGDGMTWAQGGEMGARQSQPSRQLGEVYGELQGCAGRPAE